MLSLQEPEVKIVEVVQDSCQNCTVLQENFRDISEELALEKDRVASLENDLAESQVQIQKFNQVFVTLNSVCQTFLICLSNTMFDRFTTSQNIIRRKFLLDTRI